MELTDDQHAILTALRVGERLTSKEVAIDALLTGSKAATILRELETGRLVARDVDANRGAEVWIITVRGADALDAEG